ncbi:peptide chain release factor N(5)-glutamine methyltransferase [Mycolicibacterium pulveris]|uniref:Release factor glutamine methyltransferase n=1 Tax=Mycolicibacterium pulveris TaxID=36813 RepID=A0A7I7UMJ0_MYCPV|nr:peptide chain release factor N(5)-glutamine methyltransferase [Mycolicibacterium pulveris]MCV6980972.1 peptide chain release factor N(5)-glutamine methyltransferase [Mycolicibacterium pulveris]BBY82598.1 release factor glutamine methyltransferase [Mycolicibacterium pulveris]
MMLREVIDAAEAALADAGVASPRADAELLAAHAAGTDRGRLALTRPDPAFVDRYRGLVARRAKRVPLQHITGSAAFGPVTVSVGPGVFIPRPETESLLEWAVAQPLLRERSVPLEFPGEIRAVRNVRPPVIVDLCTGSGALALALAKAVPGARVIAVDDSDDALDYARRNLAGTGVELIRADVTQPGLLPEFDGQVDLVVANPPYIPEGAELEAEVAEHDPAHALFGGPDGMVVINAVIDLAGRWLSDGGRCAVEHDDTTSARTVDAFSRTGQFDSVTARHDLAGRPRFVTATRNRRQEGTGHGRAV